MGPNHYERTLVYGKTSEKVIRLLGERWNSNDASSQAAHFERFRILIAKSERTVSAVIYACQN